MWLKKQKNNSKSLQILTNRNLIFCLFWISIKRISVEWLFFPKFSFSTVIAISPFLVLNSRFPVNFLSRTKYLLQLSQRGSDFLAFNSTPSWLGANLKANETPTAKKIHFKAQLKVKLELESTNKLSMNGWERQRDCWYHWQSRTLFRWIQHEFQINRTLTFASGAVAGISRKSDHLC